MAQPYPVFLINLDGSQARLDRTAAELDKLGLGFTRVSAVDGRDKDAADFPEYDPRATSRFMGRQLSGPEVGCHLSHLHAAQAFVDTGARFGLVLEDDAVYGGDRPEEFRELMDEAMALENWDVANLGRPTRPRYAVPASPHLLRAFYLPTTTMALVWTAAGARRFLDECAAVRGPVDHVLRRFAARTGGGLGVPERIFVQSGAGSEIVPYTRKLNPEKLHPRLFSKYFAELRREGANHLMAWRNRRRYLAR